VRGEQELQCVFEKHKLKGSNTATTSQEPLRFAFSAETASNQLPLNEAVSAAGCPNAIKVGLESTSIVSSLEGEELLQQIDA
jgi:hypothetical protein